LLRENEDIRTVLLLAQSEKNENMDFDNTNRLIELIESLDSLNSQAKMEQSTISKVDKEVRILK